MAESLSASDILKRNRQAMGDKLGSLYTELWQETVVANARWNEFLAIYGINSERVELVNKAAPWFFKVVQDCVWEYTLLHIARLTEKVKRHDTLSLFALPMLVDEEIREEVKGRIDTVYAESETIRTWRDKYIAHKDRDFTTTSKAQALPPVTRSCITKMLRAIDSAFNLIAEHYLGESIQFELIATPPGALSLLHVIYEGIDSREQRRNNLRRGDLSGRPPEYPEWLKKSELEF